MKKWILFALLLVPQFVYAGEWVDIKPIGPTRGESGYLADIYSQVEPNIIGTYLDGDLVTSGHECTHAIHARIRNSLHVANGVYLLKGKAFTIGKCPIKLNQLAAAVPQNKRGRVYQLYLVSQQRDWNDDALYILDELCAYTNGCIVGLDKNLEYRTIDSFNRVKEMYGYAEVLQGMCRKSNFKEQKDLDTFLSRLKRNRIGYIEGQIKKRNWTNGPSS